MRASFCELWIKMKLFSTKKCIWICRLWNGTDFVYVSMHYTYQFICHIATHYSDVIMSAVASQITSVCSGADHRKHQSSASLAFVRGIHRWPVDSPHKEPVTRKCFHLMPSSWVENMPWKHPYIDTTCKGIAWSHLLGHRSYGTCISLAGVCLRYSSFLMVIMTLGLKNIYLFVNLAFEMLTVYGQQHSSCVWYIMLICCIFGANNHANRCHNHANPLIRPSNIGN